MIFHPIKSQIIDQPSQTNSGPVMGMVMRDGELTGHGQMSHRPVIMHALAVIQFQFPPMSYYRLVGEFPQIKTLDSD